jgi:hypothetical protein
MLPFLPCPLHVLRAWGCVVVRADPSAWSWRSGSACGPRAYSPKSIQKIAKNPPRTIFSNG